MRREIPKFLSLGCVKLTIFIFIVEKKSGAVEFTISYSIKLKIYKKLF